MTDLQRTWDSEGVVRLGVRLYDLAYRRLRGLTDPAAAVGPVLRLAVQPYRGAPLTLADGTPVRRGDAIGEIHLNNEGVAAMHEGGRRSRWAGLAFRRAFHASLEALAEQVVASPRYRDVRAFTATTIFHHGTDLMGFEVRPLGSPLAARVIAGYERMIMGCFHPLGPQRPGRPRFTEARRIWISKSELVRRYVSARSSARGTHA